jgi:hypothetical protein
MGRRCTVDDVVVDADRAVEDVAHLEVSGTGRRETRYIRADISTC